MASFRQRVRRRKTRKNACVVPRDTFISLCIVKAPTTQPTLKTLSVPIDTVEILKQVARGRGLLLSTRKPAWARMANDWLRERAEKEAGKLGLEIAR
jgi:hypothetical protein